MLIINEIPPPEFLGRVSCALIVKCTALFSVCRYCKYSKIYPKHTKLLLKEDKLFIRLIIWLE